MGVQLDIGLWFGYSKLGRSVSHLTLPILSGVLYISTPPISPTRRNTRYRFSHFPETLSETLTIRIYSTMADEEVMGSASPAPSDHKRKLDDLDSEPFEQPPVVSGEYNGNSQPVADGDGDAVAAGGSTEDPDVKRPRIDEKSDGFEATDNGHQQKEEEPKEDITDPSDLNKNTESEDLEKANEPLDAVQKAPVTDEPLDAVNNEPVNDELLNKESVPDELLNKESVIDEPVNKESVTDDLVNNDSLTDELVNKESVADETHEKALEQELSENLEQPTNVEHQGSGIEQQDPTTYAAKEDDAFGFKEQSTFSDQSTSRRMEIPSNKVGVLIGKSGDTIRTLQHSSGARIQITRDSEADPNAPTRPVQLVGSIESINKAERLIKEVIAEADAGGSPSLVARGFSVHSSGIGEQVHIQVPNDKVGVIIGKGGDTIKSLQTRSGARIQLIPQHLPEGDQSKERTVRVSGDRKQIEMAREMIKEVMDQISHWVSIAFLPIRSSNSTGGYNQQNFRPRGSGGSQWGPRGGHPSQSSGGYNNYPPRGGYSSQNAPYSSQGYGNYPPQQPPPRNNYGWDQRPPTNKQGPPDQGGYDYYGGQGGGHMAAPSPQPPPMHSHAPGPAMGPPPYNYGPPQGPDYGPPSASYPQTAPQGYGQGYNEPRYDHQGPGQHSYGGQGTQPPAYPQGGAPTHPGYGQPDQYGKPPAYNMPPQQGPYGQPYGQPPRQQPYPASSGSTQQGYPQYGTPPVNDGYSGAAPGGYGQQGGQPASGYGQPGGQQPNPGYAQAAPTGGYAQYPPTQPGYNEQTAPNNAGYGYQGGADPAYGGGPGMAAYGAPPPVQPPAYSQPAPAPVPAPVQPGYDQSVPQTGGYVAPQPQPQAQPQPGYGQYDGSQMYAGHR
ncbi:hypothetical protein SSX86_010337 [Deinandra increscens subsp. villosa]|uniref:K Homology domain-containing protein n=1 Tax=Deinandra increscens subsp. villosa TaxID=3103831 RepID=A0AAP0DF36_9ASTR